MAREFYDPPLSTPSHFRPSHKTVGLGKVKATKNSKVRSFYDPDAFGTESFESFWSAVLRMEPSPKFTINMLEKILFFTLSRLQSRVYEDDACEIVTESEKNFSLTDRLQVSAMPRKSTPFSYAITDLVKHDRTSFPLIFSRGFISSANKST